MAGIHGIGGPQEPTLDRPANDVRNRRRDEAQSAPTQDGVQISAEAREAANTQRLTQIAQEDPGIRQERVEEARAALERGDYRDLNVLREVARNIMEML